MCGRHSFQLHTRRDRLRRLLAQNGQELLLMNFA